MQREQLGRGLFTGELNLSPAQGSGGWWAGLGYQCQGAGRTPLQRPYLQRLTATGDTLPGWWLAPTAPRATATAVLVRGGKLLTCGTLNPTGQATQFQQVTLTCSDTATRQVLWTRAYPRQPQANDQSAALVATPSGGYLISGDAQAGGSFLHYLIETDSLGDLRRQVLLSPLGPGLNGGSRYNTRCNVLPLPDGYLLSGTADSIPAGQIRPEKQVAYVVRLDTALHIVWAYRHPPTLSGTGATSNQAYRLRRLPGNTVGLLLAEVRGSGTPDSYLVQLDMATGQRRAMYVLSSNTQSVVVPYDWQWVGDGTLLLAGKSSQNGVQCQQGYVARWDFRATPLSARAPTAAAGAVPLRAWPNPATEAVTIDTQNRHAASMQLLDLTGRVLRVQPVAAGAASASVGLAGLPPGLYLLRLRGAAGQGVGAAKVVVSGP